MNKYSNNLSEIKRFAETKNVKCIFPTQIWSIMKEWVITHYNIGLQ